MDKLTEYPKLIKKMALQSIWFVRMFPKKILSWRFHEPKMRQYTDFAVAS
jgi:hypothetical protein